MSAANRLKVTKHNNETQHNEKDKVWQFIQGEKASHLLSTGAFSSPSGPSAGQPFISWLGVHFKVRPAPSWCKERYPGRASVSSRWGERNSSNYNLSESFSKSSRHQHPCLLGSDGWRLNPGVSFLYNDLMSIQKIIEEFDLPFFRGLLTSSAEVRRLKIARRPTTFVVAWEIGFGKNRSTTLLCFKTQISLHLIWLTL